MNGFPNNRNMNKILITGGSGFIGTNLIDVLSSDSSIDILNIDIKPPKIESQKKYWKYIDIIDKDTLKATIIEFQPNFVIHLAARTDLNGNHLEEYSSNTLGVSNLIESLNELKSLERVIFTSSMYVCQPGYIPKDFEDYKPHTLYGESKVMTEKIIKENNPQNYSWCITRPTSIWGPWFGEPYANFFHIVMSHKYFHMGKRACTKTYGYIGNTVYQIECLLNAPKEQIHQKVFYLGDWPPYDISEWANEIAKYMGIRIPHIPFFLFRIAGWGGDILKAIGIKFPMTSFRLKNMTTNNVHDLSLIKEIAPNLPVSRKEGVKITVEWINSQK